MKIKGLQQASLFALACVLAITGAWAADCQAPASEGRQCEPPDAACSDADVTMATVQIGGEGSVDTEHDCECTPGVDTDGNVVEADIEFKWDRDSDTSGKLTMTVDNVTGTFDPEATEIWWNLPGGATACSLDSVSNPGGTSWSLISPGTGEGCLGDFDLKLSSNQGVNNGIESGQTAVFMLTCTGTDMDELTGCDWANSPTLTNVGDRATTAAIHFQRTNQDNQLSDKVSTCGDELFVELAGFSAAADNGRVTLEWHTLLEIDNAGFNVLRRNVLTREITQLNAGLIPAQGDIFQGAHYSFTDETAINGVSYQYLLVDIDLAGYEAQHPGVVAVANPVRSKIQLVSPNYGSSELRSGKRANFSWDSDSRRGAKLVVSSDPTFSDASAMMTVGAGKGRSANQVTLGDGQTRHLESIARQNNGVVYWRVVEPTVGSSLNVSPTYSVGFGVLSNDTSAKPTDSGEIDTTENVNFNRKLQRRANRR